MLIGDKFYVGYAYQIYEQSWIMDDYCIHSDYDDDKLLLDDENTNKINTCIECQHSRALANGATTNHISLIVGNGDSFSDTMEAPLLINVRIQV